MLLLLSGGLSVLFVAFGGLSFGYSPKMMAMLALSGAILGAMLVPELEPGVIPFPTLWQVSLAVIGSLLFAYAINASPTGYAAAVAVGAILGLLAPLWIKHINLP